MKPNVLLVLAHPDDETIIGGFLGRCKEAGLPVYAIYLTGGEGGRDRFGRKKSLRARVRRAELAASAAIYGISDYEILGARDEPFRDDSGSPTRNVELFLTSGVWNIADLKRRMESFAKTILPYFVIGMSSSTRIHAHHQAASRLASQLLESGSFGTRATAMLTFTEPYWYGPSSFARHTAAFRLPSGVFSRVLGSTYAEFADSGAKAHRSQLVSTVGPSPFDEVFIGAMGDASILARLLPNRRRATRWSGVPDRLWEGYLRATAKRRDSSRYASAPWITQYNVEFEAQSLTNVTAR